MSVQRKRSEPIRRWAPAPPSLRDIDPSHGAYNRVIRVEGQVAMMIQIHRFLWRYRVCRNVLGGASGSSIDTRTFNRSQKNRKPTPNQAAGAEGRVNINKRAEYDIDRLIDEMLDAGRMAYFDVIEELIYKFLNAGLDLTYGGHNLNSFIRVVRQRYLRRLPRAERKKDGLWSKIWWFQHLQGILEDEHTGVYEALVNGWHWFVDPEQWPTKSSNRSEFTNMWTRLSQERRDQFLEGFVIDEERVRAWMSGLSTQGFCCENIAEEEGRGLKRELRAAGIELASEMNAPRLAEEALEDGSVCSMCGEGYSVESIET